MSREHSKQTHDYAALDALIAVRLVRLSELIARGAARVFEQSYGLRNTDLRILTVLAGAETITVNALARRTHVDKAWISRSLIELEKKGLVRRERSTDNQRQLAVTLTEAGRVSLSAVAPEALARDRLLLDGVDRDAAHAMIDRLLANAEALFDAGEPLQPKPRTSARSPVS